MKRIYLLAALACTLVGNAFAQKNVNLEVLPCMIGTSINGKHEMTNTEKILIDGEGNSKYYFTWRVKNLGPDTLRSGDSLIFKVSHLGGNRKYYWDPAVTTNPLEKDSSMGIIPWDGQQQVPIAFTSANETTSNTQTVNWCDSVWSKTGNVVHTDANLANNKVCRTVAITFWLTGINTVTNKADGFVLYPNPANGQLNVKFDFGTGAKNVSLVLRDIIGKVTYQQSFGNLAGEFKHSVDVSSMPVGIYMAELNFNDEKIVSKVSIK